MKPSLKNILKYACVTQFCSFRNKMPRGDGRKCPEHQEYIYP